MAKRSHKAKTARGDGPAAARAARPLREEERALLGAAATAHAQGRLDEALALCDRALARRPNLADALWFKGVLLHKCGRSEEALKLLRRAALRVPDAADFQDALAVVLRALGRSEEALAALDRALALAPDYAHALANRAGVLADLGRLDEAEAACARALAAAPDNPATHNNLATVLHELGRDDEALIAVDRALALAPDFIDALANGAAILCALGRYEEAEAACRKGLALRPGDRTLLSNLGTVLSRTGRLDEAEAAYREGLRRAPGDAGLMANLAHVVLTTGRFEEGWALYEQRWSRPGFRERLAAFDAPLWDGHEMAGGTVLLHAEQGLGDTLQFVRYAPLVKARGARVVVECQPSLASLVATAPGVDAVVARGEPLPEFAAHAPLLSLPRLFATSLASIPREVPYLSPPPGPLPPPLEPVGRDRRVGIVWAGSAGHANDRNRSSPFACFAALADVPGVRLFSLQVGERAEEVAEEPRITDLGPWLEDFAATARVVAALDLVISVDTAVAHLAGALGRPVWIVLPFSPDWRWLLEREDSPWYPTARLFRQDAPGAWRGVFARLQRALAAWAA